MPCASAVNICEFYFIEKTYMTIQWNDGSEHTCKIHVYIYIYIYTQTYIYTYIYIYNCLSMSDLQSCIMDGS